MPVEKNEEKKEEKHTEEKKLRYEIVEEKRNEFFDRLEVKFIIYHELQPTPTREEVRKYFEALYNKPEGTVYVVKILSETGEGVSHGLVHIYDSKESADKYEAKHIILRNFPELKEGEQTG